MTKQNTKNELLDHIGGLEADKVKLESQLKEVSAKLNSTLRANKELITQTAIDANEISDLIKANAQYKTANAELNSMIDDNSCSIEPLTGINFADGRWWYEGEEFYNIEEAKAFKQKGTR